MTPAYWRREAYRYLRAAERSTSRSLAEAERLLRLAEGHAADEVTLRRSVEANPEFLVCAGAPLQ